MTGVSIDNLEIQDFIDGRVGDDRMQAVKQYLDENSDEAAHVQAIREQDALLRVAAQPALDEPVPEKLSAVMDMARSLASAAPADGKDNQDAEQPDTPDMVATHVVASRAIGWRPWIAGTVASLALVLGVALGWGGAKVIGPSDEEKASIASEALFAYSYYSREKEYAVEFDQARTPYWNAYMKRTFATEIPPPDLSARGYSYLGARMIPGRQARMAFYMFENSNGDRLSVYFWPSDGRRSGPPSYTAVPDDVFAREWTEHGFNFAMMAPGDPKRLETDESILEVVRTFYTDLFGKDAASGN